jgi:hypothetical protein
MGGGVDSSWKLFLLMNCLLPIVYHCMGLQVYKISRADECFQLGQKVTLIVQSVPCLPTLKLTQLCVCEQ